LPLLLPPQAVATVAQTARMATAESPLVRVCIDTLLLAEDALRVSCCVSTDGDFATGETASGINLGLLSARGNARISAATNRDQTVTMLSPGRRHADAEPLCNALVPDN
jgi:hypothetical protein